MLYESHTVLHGRPFPMKGRKYANVFVHFQPVEHDAMNMKLMNSQEAGAMKERTKPVGSGKNAKIGGHEQSNHDDAEVKKHVEHHRHRHVDVEEEEEEEEEEQRIETGATTLHIAAVRGDINMVEKLLREHPEMLHANDRNSWQPLHEAVRNGHLDIVRMLIDSGADIGALTSNGASALWWAKRSLPRGHSVIAYLEGIGAPEEGELTEEF